MFSFFSSQTVQLPISTETEINNFSSSIILGKYFFGFDSTKKSFDVIKLKSLQHVFSQEIPFFISAMILDEKSGNIILITPLSVKLLNVQGLNFSKLTNFQLHFESFSFKTYLKEKEYLQGGACIDKTTGDIFFVVKHLDTKLCRIVFFENGLFRSPDRSYIPIDTEDGFPFKDISSLQFIESTKEILAISSTLSVIFILTNRCVYLKSISYDYELPYRSFFDPLNDFLFVTHLCSQHARVYTYSKQSLTQHNVISFSTYDEKMVVTPLFDAKTNILYLQTQGASLSYTKFEFKKRIEEFPPLPLCMVIRKRQVPDYSQKELFPKKEKKLALYSSDDMEQLFPNPRKNNRYLRLFNDDSFSTSCNSTSIPSIQYPIHSPQIPDIYDLESSSIPDSCEFMSSSPILDVCDLIPFSSISDLFDSNPWLQI